MYKNNTYLRTPCDSVGIDRPELLRERPECFWFHRNEPATQLDRYGRQEIWGLCRGKRSIHTSIEVRFFQQWLILNVYAYPLSQLLLDERLKHGKQHIENIRVIVNVNRLQSQRQSFLNKQKTKTEIINKIPQFHIIYYNFPLLRCQH